MQLKFSTGRMKSFYPSLLFSLFFFGVLAGILFVSCSPTKYVPDGAYLLDKVEIKSDAREINKNDLPEYVRQMPNSYILGLFRMQLGFYNMSGKDTTKWINRLLRRIGQQPVIMDSILTESSAEQLLRFHRNKGYYDATINTLVTKRNKKARISYLVKSNSPYLVGSYKVDVPHQELEKLSKDSTRSLVQRNMVFDLYQLDNERERLTSRMRRMGYYNFMKDYLTYTADSTGRKVDVTLQLRDYLMNNKDTLEGSVFKQFYISKVIFNLSPALNPITAAQGINKADTTHIGGYEIISPKNKFLTYSALVTSTFIKPGTLYSDADVEKTYAALNSLSPVKYTHISFSETAPDSLQCLITIAESKTFTFTSQADITFTEGYWGMAGNLGVIHRNLFKGAEALTLQGRMALEKQDNVIAQEWGGQVGIRVPKTIIPFVNDAYSRSLRGSTEFRGTFKYQYRPEEFSSTNAGIGVKYNWITGRQHHALDLLDLTYVHFPWKSRLFIENFIESGKYNRYNYEDYLIMRLSYNTAISSFNPLRPMRNYFTCRYGAETAGNLLYGIHKILHLPADSEGFYKAFNIRFSQYVRGEINVSYHQIMDKNNKFVYHAGIGAGLPYGNAEIIPFERRFYSGGANSVRGWGESQLGPGTYQRFSSFRRRDYNQVGDIKLDLNFEYRAKMFWVLEGAIFADAGNIWTIREYSNQKGGVFRFDSFWKQIALAYGIGIRMDFNFFLFRIDAGLKLYDPAALSTTKWILPSSFKDLALHIAIGYPF